MSEFDQMFIKKDREHVGNREKQIDIVCVCVSWKEKGTERKYVSWKKKETGRSRQKVCMC